MRQVTVYVDPSITATQVKELQAKLKIYMQEESRDDWQQPADPYIIVTDVRVSDCPHVAACSPASGGTCVA